MKPSVCSRCGGPVGWNDEMALDQARADNPAIFSGGHICNPCYERISLSGVIAAISAARNISPQALIKEILEKYESLD